MPVKRITSSGAIGGATDVIRIKSVQLVEGGADATLEIANQAGSGGESICSLFAWTATSDGQPRDSIVFGEGDDSGLKLTTRGYATITGSSAYAIIDYTVRKGQ